MKRLLLLCLACVCMAAYAQVNDVLQAARLTNDYFMQKYSDPTVPTNVKRYAPATFGHGLSTTRD